MTRVRVLALPRLVFESRMNTSSSFILLLIGDLALKKYKILILFYFILSSGVEGAPRITDLRQVGGLWGTGLPAPSPIRGRGGCQGLRFRGEGSPGPSLPGGGVPRAFASGERGRVGVPTGIEPATQGFRGEPFTDRATWVPPSKSARTLYLNLRLPQPN